MMIKQSYDLSIFIMNDFNVYFAWYKTCKYLSLCKKLLLIHYANFLYLKNKNIDRSSTSIIIFKYFRIILGECIVLLINTVTFMIDLIWVFFTLPTPEEQRHIYIFLISTGWIPLKFWWHLYYFAYNLPIIRFIDKLSGSYYFTRISL